MTRSPTMRGKSGIKIQERQPRQVMGSGDSEAICFSGKKGLDQISESITCANGAWNDAISCEARNSLQVVLSGAEILLEDHLGNLVTGQKELLAKMTDNAHYLSQLLAALLGPEEFKVEVPREKGVHGSPRVSAKV